MHGQVVPDNILKFKVDKERYVVPNQGWKSRFVNIALLTLYLCKRKYLSFGSEKMKEMIVLLFTSEKYLATWVCNWATTFLILLVQWTTKCKNRCVHPCTGWKSKYNYCYIFWSLEI